MRIALLRMTGAVAMVLGLGLGIASLRQGAEAQTGITLKITAPADSATVSNPVSVSVQTTGANIKAATEGDANSQHYHYFIDKDPAGIVKQGESMPSGQPDIVHTADATLALPTLAPGKHTVWVVLGKVDHTPLNPSVEAKVSFTVAAGAAQATPAAGAASPASLPTNGDDLSMPRLVGLLAALALLIGGFVAIRFANYRRA